MSAVSAGERAPRARYVAGAVCGLGAILIWAGWMSVTRLGVTTSMTATDVTMLRFGTAGLVLLPIVIREGLALDRIGWWRLLILVVGAGAPYAMVAAMGLRFAPAAHAGVLIPGVMPLLVALLSLVFLKERFTSSRKVGYGLILLGVAMIAGLTAVLPGQDHTKGHLLFLTGAFMWACYVVTLRQSRLAPLHAAALVSVGSAVLFLPVYLMSRGLHLPPAPVSDILVQAIFQGIFATVIALYLFGKAVSILGASGGAAFGALVPALAALIAIPVLGEIPTLSDWLGIIAVSSGVYLASGGPVWRRG
ncbi:DMT family transporter [Rhodoligotrophos defluvii]|uniref:DMT family transporter n=1 Tax=Rhodoligotrophos defluvii TaxID=2561934 RepID=UPI001EF0C9C4|nr:DMT family transporter [Rhodoligotrophos defluvii]